MGRAQGGPKAASALTGGSRSTAAAAGGAGAGGAGPLTAIITLRGTPYIAPVSTDPSVRIPAAELSDGSSVYPVMVREDRRAFDAALLTRMLKHGQVMPIAATGATGRRDWATSLWRDDVGTRALGAKTDRKISEARLREEMHAAGDAMGMPIGPVRLPDGQEGMGLLRDRVAVRAYAAKLRGRNAAQRQSLVPMVKHADAWWALSSDNQARRLANQPSEQQAIVGALGGEAQKNRVLAAAVWGQELRERADGDDDAYERLLAGKASSIRSIISGLRRAGLPIEGNPAYGYRLLRDQDELIAYGTREVARMQQTEAHATAADRAGALWYPEGATEEAEARAWRSELHEARPSAHTVQRASKRRQAQAKAVHQDPAIVGARRADEIKEMPSWHALLAKVSVGTPLAQHERLLRDEMKAARKAAKTGLWPRRVGGRQYPWDERPAA